MKKSIKVLAVAAFVLFALVLVGSFVMDAIGSAAIRGAMNEMLENSELSGVMDFLPGMEKTVSKYLEANVRSALLGKGAPVLTDFVKEMDPVAGGFVSQLVGEAVNAAVRDALAELDPGTRTLVQLWARSSVVSTVGWVGMAVSAAAGLLAGMLPEKKTRGTGYDYSGYSYGDTSYGDSDDFGYTPAPSKTKKKKSKGVLVLLAILIFIGIVWVILGLLNGRFGFPSVDFLPYF